MAGRGQMNEIFLGVTPSPVRAFLKKTFRDLRGRYARIVAPCIGRFTVAEAALDAGWAPEDIYTSDVSLFSALLGYQAAGRPLAELGISLDAPVFPQLQQYVGTEREIGATLLAMKLCQLREDKAFDRMFIKELVTHADGYVAQLQKTADTLISKLHGIRFELMDVTAVVEEATQDPSAVVYVNPPGFAKGYSKMFNFAGRIGWSDPAIPEFDPPARRRLYDLAEQGRALSLIYRSQEIEPGFEHWAVFCAEGAKRKDYVLSPQYEALQPVTLRKKITAIHSARLPFIPDDHEITPDSKIAFHEVDRSTALYYRDLFAHKLGVTRAERYFLVSIDGFLMAVFGMFFSEVQRGVSGKVYETFGFCAPCKRYPRLNHLFMTAICSEDARQFYQASISGALKDVDAFQTTCLSTTPEQKSHRSTGLKLIHRSKWDEARFKLVYYGPFKPWSLTRTVQEWLKRCAEAEKQTGRGLGVTKMPSRLIDDEAA